MTVPDLRPDPLLPPPNDLLVISAAEVADLLDLTQLRDGLAAALRAHSDGDADVPPRIAARSAQGWLGAMPGNVTGLGMAAKLVSVFPGNHGGEIPSHQGLIAVFDQDDGRPLAVMDGAYLTGLRTAATAALAVDLMARSNATTLAIIGAGVQGHAHARTLAPVRAWSDIRVASRTRAHASALSESAPDVRAVDSFEEAVRGADVVALCTDAPDPVIDRAWLRDGASVTSVGVGREIDQRTIADAARVLVEWRGAAETPPPAGAHELQGVEPGVVVELGEVVAGRHPARIDDAELVVYKSTGHAVEDVAAARLVFDVAQAAGAGTRVRL